MKKNSQAFINHLLICLLVTFGFSGSIGLGTVWMRHQISITANANKALESRIVELERHLSGIKALVETEQGNEALFRRNEKMQLGLVQPQERQSIQLTEDPVRHLAAKRNRDLFNDGAPAAPRITFASTP